MNQEPVRTFCVEGTGENFKCENIFKIEVGSSPNLLEGVILGIASDLKKYNGFVRLGSVFLNANKLISFTVKEVTK